MLCVGAGSAGGGDFQRHSPNHSRGMGDSGKIKEDPFKGEKRGGGGGNLRIFSPPGFKPGIDASRWLVAASQGPVLRRIRELHSAHEEGAV